MRWIVIVVASLTVGVLARGALASPAPSFVEGALCVHSGWHYSSHRVTGHSPDYVLWGRGFWRTWKLPYGLGSEGEGSWTGIVGSTYGGGFSFMVGTWNRAGSPYARSTSDIARAPVAEQIRRAWVITGHGRTWREWPQTGRACGLPQQ